MHEEICGTCKWHQRHRGDKDWTCYNEESEYNTDYTEYRDSCEAWEGRER